MLVWGCIDVLNWAKNLNWIGAIRKVSKGATMPPVKTLKLEAKIQKPQLHNFIS